MAKFEGVKWASQQMRYGLVDKQFELLPADARVYAVSRSIHYGLFLAFEGIRFFCKKNERGRPVAIFLNWHKNLERFQKGIAFNLGRDQQSFVPTTEEMERVFIQRYFSDPSMLGFFEEMAAMEAQGYLRPFTIDEEQSTGVTFPGKPAIRATSYRYDRYLGEPFCGVVMPGMVRAIGVNKTGCLKLGTNYVMSIKAIDAAREICPDSASALFLDDRPEAKLEDRRITEWDSSCCLFGFRDGSILKIPEHELILPSVTILGIVAILKEAGVPVEERHLKYGELLERAKSGDLVVTCSVGTAGILNRCQKLVLVDRKNRIIAVHHPDENHPLYHKLAEARARYWNIYKERAPAPPASRLFKYEL
jgi:branched-subunit amino acid aminotransferase/4-amino-4-deoxychorismate lyase